MWLKILAVFGELLIKFGLKKRDDANRTRADAAEKTIEGVGESLDVEKDIRDAQDKVNDNPTDVKDEDGGLNFDEFNEGKK